MSTEGHIKQQKPNSNRKPKWPNRITSSRKNQHFFLLVGGVNAIFFENLKSLFPEESEDVLSRNQHSCTPKLIIHKMCNVEQSLQNVLAKVRDTYTYTCVPMPVYVHFSISNYTNVHCN